MKKFRGVIVFLFLGLLNLTAEGASITVTTPNGGESLQAGTIYTVTWTASNDINNVLIEYSVDGGGKWKNIVWVTSNDGSHDWTVPAAPSDNCLVRISGGDVDDSPSDVSDAVFSIVSQSSGEITVTSPNGGENAIVGSTCRIAWKGDDSIDNVTIEYSTNNGASWISISASTPNDGSYDWVVPGTMSDTCLIRVGDTDGSPSDVSDSVFSIVPAPSIAVTSPNGGESLETGSIHTITWTADESLPNVKIDYTVDDGASWLNIAAAVDNDGSYRWTVPDTPSVNCRVRVGGYDSDEEVSDISDSLFSIVPSSLSRLVLTSPNGGERLSIASTHQITWNSYGTVGDVKIEYSTDNGETWTEIAASTPNSGSYDWTVPDDKSSDCLVRIGETDGEPSDVSDAEFSIVSMLTPTIIITSPNGGERLTVGTLHEITWSSTGAIVSVMIEYSTDNGDTWTDIESSAGDDGNYRWTVPDDPSGNCLVRIGRPDADGEPSDVSDAVFSIVTGTLECGETWEVVAYQGTHWDAAYGNSTFVSVGNGGLILTGSDGSTWTPRTSGTSKQLQGVTYGGSLFVVVGEPGIVLTSPDGIQWSIGSTGSSQWFQRVGYGDSLYIAVGQGGAISTSSNGFDWTAQSSGVSDTLQDVAYGNGMFAVVGNSGKVLTGTGSGTWTPQSLPVNENLNGVAYGSSLFTAVGANGTIITSPDGVTWTQRSSGVSVHLASVVYGNSQFVAVGKLGEIVTSPDGINWTVRTSGTSNKLSGVAYGNERFVGVGDNTIVYSECVPAGPVITVTSPNGGENWELGTVETITWDAPAVTGTLEITLLKAGSSAGVIADQLAPGTGSYSWTVGDLADGTTVEADSGYSIKIGVTDSAVADFSDAPFTITDNSSGGTTIVYGRVFEAENESPLPDAMITASGRSALSDANGYWKLVFSSGGTLKIKITKDGYTEVYRKIYLDTGEEGVVDNAYLTLRDTAVTVIGPVGGTHSNADGTVEVIVPPGALNELKDFRTTRLSSSKALPGGLNETDNLEYPINFLFCADFEPDGVDFNSPVKIRVQNTWGFPAGTEIPYAYWDRETQKWVSIGMATVDAAGDWMEGEVTHFSTVDCNIPAVSPDPEDGYADSDLDDPPDDDECIGSSVDTLSGNLVNSISIPGVMVRGGDTGLRLIYNSSTAYPSYLMQFTNYHDDQLVTRPERTAVKIMSPLLNNSSGTAEPVELFFNSPELYGKGGLMFRGMYPDGRAVSTGYQSIRLSYYNYYPGVYALTDRWGGIPVSTTNVASLEPAYYEEILEKEVFFVSQTNSNFGTGWWPEGLKRLHFNGNLAAVADADGSYLEFERGTNFADAEHGTVFVSSNYTLYNPGSMLKSQTVQKAQALSPTYFSIASTTPEGTDQEIVIDLGRERNIYKIGIAFPSYWKLGSVWDYIKISVSTDNQSWEEWSQIGIPSLSRVNKDALDETLKSPYLATGPEKTVRYIKFNLGYPGYLNYSSSLIGSKINRIYAVGEENSYALLSDEKWPKLEEDSVTGNYSLTDIAGDQTIFDASGLMIARKAQNGRTLIYEYSNSKLSRILYPENVWMEFIYDANGILQKVKDSTGRETSIITDGEGNIKEVVYPDTTKREFNYDSRGLMVMDKQGDAVKSYTWDEEWPVLTKITLPNSGERTLDPPLLKNLLNGQESSYDNPLDFPSNSSNNDQLTSVMVDEVGIEKKSIIGKGWKSVYINDKFKEKIYFADSKRNRIPYKIEKGDTTWETTNIVYNDQLLIREIEIRNTDVQWYYGGTSIQYGPGSRLNIIKHATFEYTPENRLYRVVEKDGAKVFTYDTNGNVTRTEETYYYSLSPIVTDFTYNAQDDLTLIEYMDGKTQEMVYDSKGLLQTFKKNDGSEITVSRNDRGEIISITDEEDRTVTIERDILGRVTKETSPSGRDVQYVWENTGCSACGSDVKLTKIIDPGNKQWEFKYDVMGNVIEMIYPDSSKLLKEYDDASRPVKFTNKRGQIIQYQYDSDGRLQKKIAPEGEVTYTYDDRDRVTEIITGDYHYRYRYGHVDTYGNTAVQEDNLLNGQWVHHLFNYFGFPRTSYVRTPGNDLWMRTIDHFGNETTIVSPFGGPTSISESYIETGATSNFWSSYGYDALLRLARKSTSVGQDDISYDTNGVLSGINTSSGNFPVHLNFTRDESGLITGISGDKQLSASYNPDLETSDVQHSFPMSFDEVYTYDTRGNRLTSLTLGFTYDDLNRLTETTTHTYQYDADGNMIEEKNKLTTETKKYYYDSENRLIRYEHYANDLSPVDITAEYKYDLYGRRIQKTVNGTVTNFLWDMDNLAVEMDVNGNPIRKYFYSEGMDDYEGHLEFAEVVDWRNNKDGKYYYQKDQVGTVYRVISQKDAQVVESRAYDVFGNVVGQTGTSRTPIGFQGKYFDQESGLYYFYHRYYNPTIGRFITEDPIGFEGGLNMYAFVLNNPVMLTDPLGYDALTDDNRVRMRMCCLWQQMNRFEDSRIRYERSFTVYQNNTQNNYLMFQFGTKSIEENQTTTKINVFSGFNIIAWFHTHPKGQPNQASGDDINNIGKPLKIPIYVLGDEKVTKWDNGRTTTMMSMQSLAAWCLGNMSLWEKCCR